MSHSRAAAPPVELRAAAFGYADRAVVSGATLRIDTGEVVALLGPNGSGKSTLVRGILGLNDHLGGEVLLFGTPLADFTQRFRIGYVPQRHSLSTSVRATVQEVVSIGRLPRLGWRASLRRGDAVVERALDLVGLADRAREDVSTLSGGQQRRVLIARALAAEPDVLLMDEPTAGVDAASQAVLVDVLGRLATRGTTMVIVTHELEPLSSLVQRVVCTSAGHLDFDGPIAAYRLSHTHGLSPDGHHHDHENVEERQPALPGGRPEGPLDHLGGAGRG